MILYGARAVEIIEGNALSSHHNITFKSNFAD